MLSEGVTMPYGENIGEGQLRQLIDQFSFRNRLDRFQPETPIIVRGKGSLVWDIHGKPYVDFNAGQMCSALGHNHDAILEAIRHACESLIHASSTLYNVAEILLAARLAELSPAPLSKSLFLSSGSDSNEAAMSIAKSYTGGYEIWSPHLSFHGLSDTPRAVTHAGWRDSIGPFSPGNHAMFAPYCYRCPLGLNRQDCGLRCVDASFELIDAETTGNRAAVITETLFSAGGVVEAPDGWLKRVQEKCRERDMLLIVDEAQTGLAKLGTFYSYQQQQDTQPDIVTLSKHFGGGVEVSAVVTTEQIEEKVIGEGFVYSHSHTSDPLACWAALASLEIIEDENLYERSDQIGEYWKDHLLELQAEFEVIGDVRGRGLIQGIELVSDRETKMPLRIGQELYLACLEKGLIFSVRRNGSVLRFVPPFTTTTDQLDQAAEILRSALQQVTHSSLDGAKRAVPRSSSLGGY